MSDVLSREEMESLLAQSSQPQANRERSPVRRSGGEEMPAYDFYSPGRFSKEQMRTLQLVHSSFARSLTTVLSAYLNTPAQTELIAVELLTFDEYLKFVSMPPAACVFHVDPLAGSGVLEMEPRLAYAMIDRLVGGRGEPRQQIIADRHFTAVEQAIVRRIMDKVLEAYAEPFAGMFNAKPEIQGLATAETLNQIALPADVSLVCLFDLSIGPARGVMSICFPVSVLEAMLSRLSTGPKRVVGVRRQTETMSKSLRKSAEDAEIDVRIILGRAGVTVGELLQLDVGDVIRLETNSTGELEVCVEGIPKFSARPGTVGRRMAVQITEVRRPVWHQADDRTFEQTDALAA